MNKIKIDLVNCYGIKNLEHEFDFSDGKNAFLIYASNGAMKTSFANVFDGLTHDPVTKPIDRYFPKRLPKCSITDENDNPIDGENIFVVHSQAFDFDPSQRISTLLAKPELKKRYEEAYLSIEEEKDRVVKMLGIKAGFKGDVEQEIQKSFAPLEEDIFSIFENIRPDIENEADDNFSDISYGIIFNDRVVGFLKDKEVQKLLSDYIANYEKLVDESPYFRKGGFNHDHASDVGKILKKEKFFSADHKVLIFDEIKNVTKKSKNGS